MIATVWTLRASSSFIVLAFGLAVGEAPRGPGTVALDLVSLQLGFSPGKEQIIEALAVHGPIRKPSHEPQPGGSLGQQQPGLLDLRLAVPIAIEGDDHLLNAVSLFEAGEGELGSS